MHYRRVNRRSHLLGSCLNYWFPVYMQNDAFEWDDTKAESNARRHGVTFEAARGVFTDSFAIEWLDETHGTDEERFVIVGMAEGRLLYVSYTVREPRIRIISARLAERYERRRYHNENQA